MTSRLLRIIALFAFIVSGPDCLAGSETKSATKDIAPSGIEQGRWLLYEVRQEKNLVAYIFGSAHNPIGDVRIPQNVFDSLRRSKIIFFEFNFFDNKLVDEANSILMTNAHGALLSEILLPQTVLTLEDLYAFNRLPVEGRVRINTWTPYMAVLALNVPCSVVPVGGGAPEKVIYEFAKLINLPIGPGLEQPLDQLGRLAEISKEQWDSYVQAHVAWLKDPQCPSRLDLNNKRIWAGLTKGDADAIYDEYMRFYTEDIPTAWFQEKYFLTVRNAPMVERIVAQLKPNAIPFFSIGAMHLGGPNGIVKQLRQKGYQVIQK